MQDGAAALIACPALLYGLHTCIAYDEADQLAHKIQQASHNLYAQQYSKSIRRVCMWSSSSPAFVTQYLIACS